VSVLNDEIGGAGQVAEPMDAPGESAAIGAQVRVAKHRSHSFSDYRGFGFG
jgi:hypothetical protein